MTATKKYLPYYLSDTIFNGITFTPTQRNAIQALKYTGMAYFDESTASDYDLVCKELHKLKIHFTTCAFTIMVTKN